MTPAEFSILSGFLKEASGLALQSDKVYLAMSRLPPVAALHGLASISELVANLKGAPTSKLKQDVVEAMTTNETSFFRDVTPFEIFKTYVLNHLLEKRKANRSVRILCAAASSGQEPYSLAMVLAENSVRLAGWNIEILGVDLDTQILKRAEQATYSQFEVQRGLPIQLLMKYFEKTPDNNWKLKPQIRNLVKFRQCNLLHPLRFLGHFDVIFCRNVLIYFDPPTKRNVLDQLAGQLSPDGFLFLGGAETVLDITDRFAPSPGHRGVYLPRPAGALASREAAAGA